MEFLKDHWEILITLITFVFGVGIIYQKMKGFITREEVSKMIGKEVAKQLVNHCPFSNNVGTLQEEVAKLKLWRHDHTAWGKSENEKNHLILQELAINLKNVCGELKIDYLTNGKG